MKTPYFFGYGPTMAEAIEDAGKVHKAEGWTDVSFVCLLQITSGWLACFKRGA